MKNRCLYLFTFVYLITSCTNNNPNTIDKEVGHSVDIEASIENDQSVEDGFYLILNEWNDASEIEKTNGTIISFNHDFWMIIKKGSLYFSKY